MSNPKEMLKGAPMAKMSKYMGEDQSKPMISHMIAKVFATRGLLHIAHLSTASYAQHMALGGLYDEIVDMVDNIAEVYQGKNGIIAGLYVCGGSLPSDIVKHVKEESEWLSKNKYDISQGCSAVTNLLEELEAAYLKALYKLQNLK